MPSSSGLQQPSGRRGKHPASFRDPSGFLYRNDEGLLLRQINASYLPTYRQLRDGGLYDNLVADRLLVEHEELPAETGLDGDAALIIRPRQLPFICYPYEWPFGGLKNAALLTLEIHRRALEHGMALKDASGFNIQFDDSHPLLIDTLSFETFQERPWIAYRQFCRHFLAPLALAAWQDPTLGNLLAVHLDGIPLELASRLLPRRSWLTPGLLMHLHLHARMIRRHADRAGSARDARLSKTGQLRLIESLKRTVRALNWTPSRTQWSDYDQTHGYNASELAEKDRLVRAHLQSCQPQTVWDLGANTGRFSRMAADAGARVVAFDADLACVERLYQQCREERRSGLLALRQDLTNPSPALGWAHTERQSLSDRGPVEMVLALALVHHLAISNNLPFERISSWLATLCRHLLIEWVPRSDPQTQRLLRSRENIFEDYDQAGFEAGFAERFSIRSADRLADSGRVIYWMVRRD